MTARTIKFRSEATSIASQSVTAIVIFVPKEVEVMKPPFSGSIEFQLAFRAFDESVRRKVRATYTYTPPWAYYHVRSGKERTGQLQLDLGLTLLAVPRSDRNRIAPPPTTDPYWVRLGQLLTVGVLRTKVHDQLRARIDAESLDTDRRNRIAAGLPVPPLPEQI